MGIGKDGEPKDSFQLGMELTGRYTIFAEGARGQLGRQLLERFRLTEGKDPQTYAIGVKELWEVPADKAEPGRVMHTAGWPMDRTAFGGGFLYHLEGNLVAVGFVIGLDYSNPWLSPFEEMQRWKTHPAIRSHLEGGKRLSYGARAINNGGPQALPKLVFPGGALVGCDAGFMNAARVKGSHAAIKSGMLAAEALAEALAAGRSGDELAAFPELFRKSWLYEELQQSRNFKPWFKKGPLIGELMTGVEHWLLPKIGVASPPWTIHTRKPDYASLKLASECPRIDYPKPDGKLTFDRLGSVFISNVNHEEDQPPHLTLKDPKVPVDINFARYAGPEQTLLPGGGLRVRQYRRARRATGDQRAELCPLQDLRHQGPDPEHRLGRAGRRRRSELFGHVTPGAPGLSCGEARPRRRGIEEARLRRHRIMKPGFAGLGDQEILHGFLVDARLLPVGGPVLSRRPAQRGRARGARRGPGLCAGAAHAEGAGGVPP